jgi:hypothetical protein
VSSRHGNDGYECIRFLKSRLRRQRFMTANQFREASCSIRKPLSGMSGDNTNGSARAPFAAHFRGDSPLQRVLLDSRLLQVGRF